MLKLHRYTLYFWLKLSFLCCALFIAVYFFLFSRASNSEVGILFAIDVSHSMNVNDIKKNTNFSASRLDAIKYLVHHIVEENPNSKFGVVLFSQKAYYTLPFTYDRETLLTYIDTLTTHTLPFWGTDLVGLSEFMQTFPSWWQQVIVFSDGGEEEEFRDNDFKKILKKSIALLGRNSWIIVGMWSANWGVVEYPDGRPLLAQSGNVVYSSLNTNSLALFTHRLKGKYVTISHYDDIKSETWNLTLSQWIIVEKKNDFLYPLLAILVILWI